MYRVKDECKYILKIRVYLQILFDVNLNFIEQFNFLEIFCYFGGINLSEKCVNVSCPTYGDDQMPSTIVFTGMLQNLLTDLCCSVCGSNNLKLVTNADQDRGLAVCLGVVCGFCGNACSTTDTSPKLASGAFEVNRRFVASGLNLGCSQPQKLSEGMGMKSLSLKAHQDHQERVWESSKDHSKAVLDQAAKTVHKMYKEALYEDNRDDILDICESYDGTWQKRGHTSNVGMGCAIDSVTGHVVHYHVMSTFCQVFFLLLFYQ